jgi:hypothetical protein
VQHMRNVGVTQNAHTPRPKATSLSTSCRSSSCFSPFAGRPLMPGEGASRTPRTATPCRASLQTTRRNPGRTWSRCSRSPSMLRPRTRTGLAPAGSLSCVRVCSAEVLGDGCRNCPNERPRLLGHQPGVFAVMDNVAQSFGCMFLSGPHSRTLDTLDRFFSTGWQTCNRRHVCIGMLGKQLMQRFAQTELCALIDAHAAEFNHETWRLPFESSCRAGETGCPARTWSEHCRRSKRRPCGPSTYSEHNFPTPCISWPKLDTVPGASLLFQSSRGGQRRWRARSTRRAWQTRCGLMRRWGGRRGQG